MFSLFQPSFTGGIHPKSFKELTSEQQIRRDFWPRNVYLSLQLRNGARLKPLVAVGDQVKRGDVIAVGRSDRVAPIHASVNGVVTAITPHMTSHPSQIKVDTVIIRANQDRSWGTTYPTENLVTLSSDDIIQRVKDAGIVGLGGAGFPTSAKLKYARQRNIKTVIVNGGECEPYITCDDVTMQAYASEIIAGIKLVLQAVGADEAIVGIEDNKPAAFTEMEYAASEEPNIRVQKVRSIYPMGSAKQLIKALTGKEVPRGGSSNQIGVLVNNISTVRSIYHAVRFRRPLISRIVTVSGKGIQEPANVEVPIGTPVNEVITFCGGCTENTERLIFGGPMMGLVIPSPQTPIDKLVGGLLALTSDEVVDNSAHQECIRCGQCVRACPMGLMPFQMAALTRASDFVQAEHVGILSCLTCGACSYVCPSHIPLVQYFMHAKGAIWSNKLQQKKSAQAKALTEAKQERIEAEAAAKKAAKEAKAARSSRPARGARQASAAQVDAPARPSRPARPGRPARPSRATGEPSTSANATTDTQAAEVVRPARPERPARPARPARPPRVAKTASAPVTENTPAEPVMDVKPERPARPARPARPPRVTKAATKASATEESAVREEVVSEETHD